MDYAKESLRLHKEWKGKIEVVTRVPAENKEDLSLAYTPVVRHILSESAEGTWTVTEAPPSKSKRQKQ